MSDQFKPSEVQVPPLEERIARRLALRNKFAANDWIYTIEPLHFWVDGSRFIIINPKYVRRLWTAYIPLVKAAVEEMSGEVQS